MNRKTILSLAVAGILASGTTAFAARDPDVNNALKKAYPGAGTVITNVHSVNGVKVSDVEVTTKQGKSTAEVTEYGDFLMYGVPHEYSAVQKSIATATQGLFKAAPSDVDMYRVTNYWIDIQGPNNKTISLRYDAVGQLKDVMNTSEIERAKQEKDYGAKVSGAEASKAEQVAKKELPDMQFEGVYKANEGEGFYWVQGKNGQVVVNPNGQVFSYNEEIDKNDVPKPILDSINHLFGQEKITKAARGEYEFYQFNEQSLSGQPLVVKMRPNGDIIEIRNEKAAQEDQAMTAKHKVKPAAPPAQKKKG